MDHAKDDDVLESQNRYLTEQLSQKVSKLRSVAYDIEVETKEHNKLLDSMGDDFEGTTGFLHGSFGRVHKVLNSGRGNRKITCYISLFLVGAFIIMYYLISRVTR
ncbi:BET1-like protein [Centruroides vittatus]|uniref:BET1-like protein n=1 Tax=Centruroides sculpturatus TaxID=218467 RepID=UPI000C6E332B|nr:BET1-like protein [Centruroides sculpturatus]